MPTPKQGRMTRHFKIMIAIVAVLGVAAVTAHAVEWGGPGHSYGHWRGAWAGHSPAGPRGIDRFCREGGGGRLGNVTALVESFAAFDGEQQAAWTRLKAAIGEGEGVVRDACDRTGQPKATVPDRLARLETMLDAGARALAIVRPAADAFYATLSKDQQAALDKLAARRRHR